MDFNALRSCRGHAKTSITCIINWLHAKKDSELSESQFSCRKEILTSSFLKYTDIQNQIDDILMKKGDADLDFETEYRIDVEEKYFDALALIQDKIKQSLPSVQSQNKITIVQQAESPAVKLPNLEISHFSGNQSEWESFFQLFDALIIQNKNLTDIQRFIYLKSDLKDEPLKLIESLNVTNQNFQIAVDILVKR